MGNSGDHSEREDEDEAYDLLIDVEPETTQGHVDSDHYEPTMSSESTGDSNDSDTGTATGAPTATEDCQAMLPAPEESQMTTAGKTPEPQLRRTSRANAGHHSNPYHLPASVIGEGQASVIADPQTLAAVAQSNLLVMQILARTAR